MGRGTGREGMVHLMKTTTKINAFAYPVTLKDNRTGERIQDVIVIPKEWLQICGSDGLNISDDKHLVYRAFNTKGYEVIEIGKRRSIQLSVDLERAFQEQTEATNKENTEEKEKGTALGADAD